MMVYVLNGHYKSSERLDMYSRVTISILVMENVFKSHFKPPSDGTCTPESL